MTGISWTDETWNPIVGCSIVSPGCTNCYAMKMADRIQAMDSNKAAREFEAGHSHYHGTTKTVNGKPVWAGKVALAPDHIITKPFHWSWKKPRMVFVNSMGDLFHEDVPDEWIDRCFAVMALCSHHTFQVLTKRSARMRAYCDGFAAWVRIGVLLDEMKPSYHWNGNVVQAAHYLSSGRPLPNVWLGISAEDQARWDERYPDLFETRAAIRFASFEPLIGRIDLCEAMGMWWNQTMNCFEAGASGAINRDKWGGKRLDWGIAGGESGPGFRPVARMEHFESLKTCCAAAGVSFFFKQDSGPRSGMRGRASDELWACKEFPTPAAAD